MTYKVSILPPNAVLDPNQGGLGLSIGGQPAGLIPVTDGNDGWVLDSVGVIPGLGTASTLNFSTDGTMAADSDALLPTQKAVVTYVAAHSATLVDWVEAVSIAAPNATVPVVSFAPVNAAASIDIAFVPKLNGGFALAVADNTATGGNKRGALSVDLQLSRSNAAMVASGSASGVLWGQGNTASGDKSCAGGNSSIASGDTAMAFGFSNTASANYAQCFGIGCLANGLYSFVSGYGGTARGILNAQVMGGYQFAATGDAQLGSYALSASTTTNAATVMTADRGAASAVNQVALPNASAYSFTGSVSARENATGDASMWTFSGGIKRGANAAATALVGVVTQVQVNDAGAAAWSIAVTADTTNGAITVTATGENAKTIRWLCAISTTEVAG